MTDPIEKARERTAIAKAIREGVIPAEIGVASVSAKACHIIADHVNTALRASPQPVQDKAQDRGASLQGEVERARAFLKVQNPDLIEPAPWFLESTIRALAAQPAAPRVSCVSHNPGCVPPNEDGETRTAPAEEAGEREKIVAWLRGMGEAFITAPILAFFGEPDSRDGHQLCLELAQAIERGDHRKDTGA